MILKQENGVRLEKHAENDFRIFYMIGEQENMNKRSTLIKAEREYALKLDASKHTPFYSADWEQEDSAFKR